MLKRILFALTATCLIGFPAKVDAESLTLRTYYPAPIGTYDRLRLVPRPEIPGNSCLEGTLYVNADDDNTLYFCRADGGNGEWAPLIGKTWMRTDDIIHLTEFNPASPNDPDLHVGIGTLAPEFALTIDNDGGIIAKGTFDFGQSLITSGEGSRLIWYPRKAAFRAGGVDDAAWNDASIGDYSSAFGYNTIASGEGSTAMGFGSMAGGANAFAAIENSTAGGDEAVALGLETTANGDASFAVGGYGIASGPASFVVGGSGVVASGANAFAAGGTTASGASSFVTGAVGVASGDNTLGFGSHPTVSGLAAFGVGVDSRATGDFSTAFYSQGIASGDWSTVLGYQFAEAGGSSSFSMGERTRAMGNWSSAVGYRIETQGDYSFAVNLGWATNYILTQPNTLAIMGGNVGIGTANPTHPLHFASGARFQANGNICTAANVCLDTFSDERLKKNIHPLAGSLQRLLRLHGVAFDWKDPQHDRQRLPQNGFLAQEVERVCPQWVSENADGEKVLNMNGFEALSVEAVREINTRIDGKIAEYDRVLGELEKFAETQNREIERLRSAVEQSGRTAAPSSF